MSHRVTVQCTRTQAEALPDPKTAFAASTPPVLVANEPDPASPDDWRIQAYFDRPPSEDEIAIVAKLGTGEPEIEQLGEADWVTMSQSGHAPIRAGRFFIHTPMVGSIPPRAVAFEIDAGLAFGTGQHSTTAGCLEALDRLEGDGAQFRTIADIGTGTGLLAFAALALWPKARCIATDLDPIAIEVASDNAAINGIKLGHGPGELLLAVADGMKCEILAARAPFDLIIANILAGPLIELAPDFARALAPGGTIILAGLLHMEADPVVAAYEAEGLWLVDRTSGEWPVLVVTRQV